ncbi:hypothetical protein BJ742DRAFT_872631 [Cladochytrium replicatum]|nr:hypothetical protein BJ742DRAFT_872631 [Cladochytrium replicatum]
MRRRRVSKSVRFSSPINPPKFPRSPCSKNYNRLRAENASCTLQDPEFELQDIREIWDPNSYHDVYFEYANVSENDLAVRVRVVNRGKAVEEPHVLPRLWVRNTCSWKEGVEWPKVEIGRWRIDDVRGGRCLLQCISMPRRKWRLMVCEELRPETLFTENETNKRTHFTRGSVPNNAGFVKDAFHERLINSAPPQNPEKAGTNCAAWYEVEVPPSGIDESEK